MLISDEELNMDDYLVFNKDEDDLEVYENESVEVENNTDSGFTKFLEEVTKKFESENGKDQNCTEGLFDFCSKYENDILGIVNSMKQFFANNSPFGGDDSKSKEFDPNISVDEDYVRVKRKVSTVDEDIPAKRSHVEDELHSVISATVETNSISSQKE